MNPIEQKKNPPDKGILIVDDDQSIREILKSALGEMRARLLLASNGEEALEILGAGEPIALALVDLVLPAMDGITLLEEIKKNSPDTEVIIMTSHPTLDSSIEAVRKGAYDYLRKPFEEIDVIEITARRALEKRTLSLKNRILLKDLEQKNKALSSAVDRLTSLNEAARAMSSIHNLEKVLDCFIELATKELGVERASLMLLQKDTDELTIAAFRGLDPSLLGTVRVKLGEGIAGWVAKKGKPLLVRDVQTDPRVRRPLDSTQANSFMSSPIVLSIPIKIKEKILGVINVTNKRTGEPFSDGDMDFLFSLARQAAVAIEGARNFEGLQETLEKLKSTQNQLVTDERLKAFGQMAAGIAHDFNNFLNSMLGNSQLIKMQLSNPSPDFREIQTELSVIEELANQGAEMVKRLQDFTGMRKDLPTEPVDLNQVVKRAVEMTRPKWLSECQSKGVRIKVKTELGDIPKTVGSGFELTQVVSNLLFNAVESMPSGGDLTLKTISKENFVCLEVKDTGLGMDKDVQAKVFEPFFTRKAGGSGLGLSIVWGIIKRYGGEITVNSMNGEGTTFTILLPVSPRVPSLIKQGSQPLEEVDFITGTILIVEDDPNNRRLCRNTLKMDGHRVLTASDGLEGVEILKNQAVDLVITDLSMPGLNGWEVAKNAKEINKGIHVILFSGWGIQQNETEAKEKGVDIVLSKPCSIDELKKKVNQALNKK